MSEQTAPAPEPRAPVLQASDEPLCRGYDVALLDLDGVVYIGGKAVPGAREALKEAASQGMRLAYVTNNASRTPAAVAQVLTGLGVPAEPSDVVTSAQAEVGVVVGRAGLDDQPEIVRRLGVPAGVKLGPGQSLADATGGGLHRGGPLEDLGRGRRAAPAEQFQAALVPGQRVAFGTVRLEMIRPLTAGPGILITVRSF